MNNIIFFIPSIVVADKTLTNVYGRIAGLQYNFEGSDGGVIQMKIGETVDPQITWSYEIAINLDTDNSFGGAELIQAVLAGIEGAKIMQ